MPSPKPSQAVTALLTEQEATLEQTWIEPIADTGVFERNVCVCQGDTGAAFVYDFVCTAEDANTTLHEKWFQVPTQVGENCAFWMDVAGGGAEPVHGQTIAREITSVTAGMTAAQVASAIYADVVALGGFNVYLQNATTVRFVGMRQEAVTAAGAGDSGFTMTEVVEGADSTLTGTIIGLTDGFNNEFGISIGNGADAAESIPLIPDSTGINVQSGAYVAQRIKEIVDLNEWMPGATLTRDGATLTFTSTQLNAIVDWSWPVGWTMTNRQYVASNLQNKYFLIGTSHYVWLNVNGEGVDPAVEGKTAIEATVTPGSTAAEVATAVANAIDSSETFLAQAFDTAVLVRTAATGTSADAGAGDSTFEVEVLRQGHAEGFTPGRTVDSIPVEPDTVEVNS